MELSDDKHVRALQGWWEEAGVDWFDEPAPAAPPAAKPAAKRPLPPETPKPSTPAPRPQSAPPPPETPRISSRQVAASAKTLADLEEAIKAYDAGALSLHARQAVFCRGTAGADLMVVGEAPGKDEDIQGQPFVGRSGQLLDRMLAAIDRGPDQFYISNVVNWRPLNNRTPSTEDLTLCLPFIERHIALAKPKALLLVGAVSAQALLRVETGIMRLRGRWFDYPVKGLDGEPTGETIPALPTYHPAFLLRRPGEKKYAWADLLALQARLDDL